MDRHAMTCPCTCHGRGPSAPCDTEYPNGCGHLHAAATGRECPGCGSPTADAALCTRCTTALETDLAAVEELAAELETTRTKQDRIGHPDPRGGQHVPLGYRPTAAEVGAVLHETLSAWARELAATAGLPPHAVPSTDTAVLAAWLAEKSQVIRGISWAGQAADEIRYAVRTTRRAIDCPPERVYAGPCDECSADLYALGHAARVVCRHCGAAYLVDDRRGWLLAALREHLATAAEIAAGVGELYGQAVNRKTINVWHHRGRLADHGSTSTGWPLFRIGDVLALAAGQTPTRPASGVQVDSARAG